MKYNIVDCIESPILRIKKQFTQLLMMFLMGEKIVNILMAMLHICPKTQIRQSENLWTYPMDMLERLFEHLFSMNYLMAFPCSISLCKVSYNRG